MGAHYKNREVFLKKLNGLIAQNHDDAKNIHQESKEG